MRVDITDNIITRRIYNKYFDEVATKIEYLD